MDGTTPIQLWKQGLCLASQSVIQPSEYGIEYDETPNMFEAGSVEIPETRVELTAQQRDYIHQNHHPLAPSDYHGVDHYLSLHKYIFATVLQSYM